MRASHSIVEALRYLLIGCLSFARTVSSSSESSHSFDWKSVEAHQDLVYTDCYDGFQCAKLLLPLDWLDLSNNNNVSIAIAMLPAKVSPDHPKFGGTVVLNPGGPSGSGVDFVRGRGRALQQVIDGEKHFDILSFDPRGVAYSEPNAHCFASSEGLEIWKAKMSAIGHFDDNPSAMFTKWAAYKAQGLLCASKDVSGYADGTNIRQFMSTPSVARDIIAIAERMDELYARARRISPPKDSFGHGHTQVKMSDFQTGALVQYWGFSYGTILGNTLASLFPDRIGRMVLDGVADAPDYMATGWSKNLQDTEEGVARFYELCFSSGQRCPLYRSSDNEPNDIQKRHSSALNELKQSPIPVAYGGEAKLITYSDVRGLFMMAQYRPYTKFPEYATVFNEMINGNYTPMLETLSNAGKPSNADLNDTVPWPHLPHGYDFSGQTQAAIACGDGLDLTNKTLTEFEEYVSLLVEQSPTLGAQWSEIVLTCTGWPSSLRPKWRYPGPFVTGRQNATAHPILFIGNTLDPVTPLRNAIAASKRHEGSRVLTQDSGGHCSLQVNPSNCTASYIKAYFNDGTLPPPGTVCPQDCLPWMEQPCEGEFIL